MTTSAEFYQGLVEFAEWTVENQGSEHIPPMRYDEKVETTLMFAKLPGRDDYDWTEDDYGWLDQATQKMEGTPLGIDEIIDLFEILGDKLKERGLTFEKLGVNVVEAAIDEGEN